MTVTLWFPAATDVMVGASGGMGRGTIGREGAEAAPRPMRLLAATVQV